MCHRDIKLENIVLEADLRVKLIDFGIACKFDPSIGMSSTVGTMVYMAPEMLQREKHPYYEKADLYSIGIVLFVMLTGCFPFSDVYTECKLR